MPYDNWTDPDAVFTTLALLPNGESRSLQAPAGWRLMEVLRDYGLPSGLNVVVPAPARPAMSMSRNRGACRSAHLKMTSWTGLPRFSTLMTARALPARS